MLKNYIKIAFRNLMRHKVYSTINVAGLAISIAACLLLYLVINYESTYDADQANYNQIGHVVTSDVFADGIVYNPGVPFALLDAVRADYPQIKSGGLYASFYSQVTVLKNGLADQKYIESSGIFFIEPQFFDIFKYKWLIGSQAVLADLNTVVLTKGMAIKYFGDYKTAMGQYIKLDNAVTMRVSGIIDDPSVHTDLPIRVIGSFITMKTTPSYPYNNDWGGVSSNFQVFMLLPKSVSPANMDERFLTFAKKYYAKKIDSKRTTFIQPLSDMHFDSRFGTLGDHTTSRSKLLTLALIGFLIIIMATINFVNLSTAKAVTRSKEIGVRKVLGSSRKQLFWQMMGETCLMVLLATVLAIVITLLALPFIQNVISLQENLSMFRLDVVLFLVGTFIIVTFLSGIYPSLILSGFTPALALKNKITSATVGGISLRRGLVITQFAVSQMLIICTIIAVSQMDFMSKADLGFNKDGVLVLNSNNDSTLLSRQPAFKQKLMELTGVQSVSFSSDVPSSDNAWATNFAFNHKPDEKFSVFLKFADEDYFKTFDIKFLAGGPYTQSDTATGVVVNQTLLKMLNVKRPEDAIGKQIHLGGPKQHWKNIVGVVRDFKVKSLRESVKPIYMSARRKDYNNTCIKLRSANVKQTEAAVHALWDKYFPEYAQTTTYMADNIDNFYKQESQLSLLYKIFAGLAILISCLGLYGLVSFMAVQKTKEVGIRKVLGAGIGSIIYLFSKEFTILICIAFAIAAPTAFYLMHNWLGNFAFQVSIGAGYFILAILSSITIAGLTVGFQAFKAARVKPIKSLRSE